MRRQTGNSERYYINNILFNRFIYSHVYNLQQSSFPVNNLGQNTFLVRGQSSLIICVTLQLCSLQLPHQQLQSPVTTFFTCLQSQLQSFLVYNRQLQSHFLVYKLQLQSSVLVYNLLSLFTIFSYTLLLFFYNLLSL